MTVRPASRHIEHPRWRSVIVTPHAGSRVVLRGRERARLERREHPELVAGRRSGHR